MFDVGHSSPQPHPSNSSDHVAIAPIQAGRVYLISNVATGTFLSATTAESRVVFAAPSNTKPITTSQQWKLCKEGDTWVIRSELSQDYLTANGTPGTGSLAQSLTPYHWKIAHGSNHTVYSIQEQANPSIVVTLISDTAVDIQPSDGRNFQNWKFVPVHF